MSPQTTESSRPTAVVFTTEDDARPFLQKYGYGRLDGVKEGESATDGRIVVTILGKGKIKATLQTERLLQECHPERVFHVGTCHSFKEQYAPGTMIAASAVLDGDILEIPAPVYPRMPLEIPVTGMRQATLVTQDHPANMNEVGSWIRLADVSDGSGYAVAYVAAMHGVPCHIVKYITGASSFTCEPAAAPAGEDIAAFLMQHVVLT